MMLGIDLYRRLTTTSTLTSSRRPSSRASEDASVAKENLAGQLWECVTLLMEAAKKKTDDADGNNNKTTRRRMSPVKPPSDVAPRSGSGRPRLKKNVHRSRGVFEQGFHGAFQGPRKGGKSLYPGLQKSGDTLCTSPREPLSTGSQRNGETLSAGPQKSEEALYKGPQKSEETLYPVPVKDRLAETVEVFEVDEEDLTGLGFL